MEEKWEQFDINAFYYENNKGISYEMHIFRASKFLNTFGFCFVDTTVEWGEDNEPVNFAIYFKDNNNLIMLYNDNIDNEKINIFFYIIDYLNVKCKFYDNNITKISISEALNSNKYLNYVDFFKLNTE
jgi:hypothetical protein